MRKQRLAELRINCLSVFRIRQLDVFQSQSRKSGCIFRLKSHKSGYGFDYFVSDRRGETVTVSVAAR